MAAIGSEIPLLEALIRFLASPFPILRNKRCWLTPESRVERRKAGMQPSSAAQRVACTASISWGGGSAQFGGRMHLGDVGADDQL